MFMSVWIPAILAYAVGVLIAWLIWGQNSSDNA
jgi:lipopolysaccharide export system protein LptC